MSDGMYIDSPNAASPRDPRLASRPTRPPISTNASLEKQTTASVGSTNTPKFTVPPTPADTALPEKQNETPVSFIQAVSGLVNAAVATAMSKSDKERLQKRKDTTEGLLKKAKAHTNFPSTAAFFQQASNYENHDLTRMNDAIKEHVSHCNQIQRGLVTKWGSLSLSSSKTEEAMRRMQNELQVAKADAANAKAEIAKMVESGSSQTGPIKILQDRVTLLERALGNHASMLNDQAKNTKTNNERLASLSSNLSSDVKRSATSSPVQGSSFTRAQQDIEDLKRKQTAMDSRIRSLMAFEDKMSGSMDKVSDNIDVQRRKLDNVSIDLTAAIRREMNSFGDQLRSLEMKVAKSPVPQAPETSLDSNGMLKSLESRLKVLEAKPDVPHPANDPGNQNVQALNARLDELGQLQAMKDDLQFSEMEDLKKTLTQHTGEFQALKDDYSNVSAHVKNLQQANPAVAHQHIQSLSRSLMTTQRVVESLKVALHSLETRYNNVSTEPIVKNMVVAMQEMYPSATQLTEQVSALRNHFEKDIVPLKGMAESLFRSHSSSMVQIQKDAASRSEEINKLKAEHTHIEQSLAGLQKRSNTTQDSGPNQQQSTELRSNIESLSKRLDEYVSKVNEQLMSKQTAEESIFQYIHHERENMIKEVRSTANNLKTLISRFGEVETVNKNNAEVTKTHWNQIESLVDRLHRLEESVSNNYTKLLEQFNKIKKTAGSPESELENGTISPVQKVEEDEDQEDQDDSPVTPSNGNNTANHLAETNPTLALREKKKKKRSRPSNLSNQSDDERQPESQSESQMSTPGREGTPSTDGKKKSKKKKKRRLHQDLEPITLD